MKHFSILIVLLALIALLPLGCAKTDEETKMASKEPSALDDSSITLSVKARMADDDLVKARKIDVDTENGSVTLRGDVSSQAEADRAVQIASNVEGVRNVRSFLKMEGETSAVEKESDLKDTAENLGTSIKEGAESAGEKTEEAARELGSSIKEGAESVGDKTEDAAITAAIKMKFARDDIVQASQIDVDTKNGHVTLTGTVSSRAEERRAIQIAKGVEDVRTVHSNLTIQ